MGERGETLLRDDLQGGVQNLLAMLRPSPFAALLGGFQGGGLQSGGFLVLIPLSFPEQQLYYEHRLLNTVHIV